MLKVFAKFGKKYNTVKEPVFEKENVFFDSIKKDVYP